jgi:hypothetical protein
LLSLFSTLAETAKYAVVYSIGSAMAVVVITPFTLAWPTTMFSVARRKDAADVFRVMFRWFSLFPLHAWDGGESAVPERKRHCELLSAIDPEKPFYNKCF